LRLELGERAFFDLLREWTARYRHASVTTDEFTDLAGHYSTVPLRPLWESWLHDEPLPQLPPHGG
ncbi:M1 family peptidase, partial [Nocardia otitidiscaviarum]|nr:M1 family peptidase [Nocardia otitidiscaviarum]